MCWIKLPEFNLSSTKALNEGDFNALFRPREMLPKYTLYEAHPNFDAPIEVITVTQLGASKHLRARFDAGGPARSGRRFLFQS